MGGSPPCGDSVRSVKGHRRQAETYQRWPQKPPNDPKISFSPDDLFGVSLPHNDPLLVVLAIDKYDVTKVLIDTGSSVDIIFQETLMKMGIDLKDVKPSSRTLTGFNGSSEVTLGTIRLSVQAEGVTRVVKFLVVSIKTPYHVILETPWLHSMRAIASTYHQCVKFLGIDGTIKSIRGDQRAARDLLIATVKLQHSQSLVNSVSPPISKVCPQKEEVLEVPVDNSDPSKVLRVDVRHARNRSLDHNPRIECRSQHQAYSSEKAEVGPREIKGGRRRSRTPTQCRIDYRSQIPGMAS
ncbi:hypothetical protein N665_1172s0007 [Sinapis alba]|nr:hypothetical protein N665_1172s0007 [Sinapis alba]